MMNTIQTVRWGILATGGIATAFGKDLSIDPESRGETRIKHQLVAAASSSSQLKAVGFLRICHAPPHAKAYGSYEDLAKDHNVDIVYIATPHSMHFQNAMLFLKSGKHVLCEKPLTVNAEQAKILAEKAREKDLLLMEGMWTRYFPLSTYVRDITSSGRLGTLQRIMSEHSLAYVDLAPDHIMVNPDLAGGILLDGGVYSLFWVFQAVYHAKDFQSRPRPVTHSFCSKYASTGVDAMTTILMEFPRAEKYGGPVHAVASTSLSLSIDAVAMNAGCEMPNIRIQGTMGEVQIFPPAYRPTKTRLILKDGTVEEKSWPQPGPGVGSGWYNGYGSTIHPEGEGHGLYWEADEAGRAICGGQKDRLSRDLEESILVLEIMDQVRAKAGLVYPKAVESTEY